MVRAAATQSPPPSMSSPHCRHRLAVPAAAPGFPGGLPPPEGARLRQEDHEDFERPAGDFPVWGRRPAGGGGGGLPPAAEGV